jgi:hypothetical protein
MSSMNITVESSTTNFWELRKATNEALQKAKSAFNTLSTEPESKQEPKTESKQEPKTESKQEPKTESKQEGWTQIKNKQSNRPIDIAQDNLIKELKAQFMPKKNYIETGLAHQVNFSHTTVINTSGVTTVDFPGNPYDFSKERFYENRHFQDRVRDAFSTIFPNGWLVFFKGRNANTYCIKIVCRC